MGATGNSLFFRWRYASKKVGKINIFIEDMINVSVCRRATNVKEQTVQTATVPVPSTANDNVILGRNNYLIQAIWM